MSSGVVALALLGALTASPAAARAETAAPSTPAPVCAHLRLVDGDADARALLGALGDLLSEDLPRLDVAMALAPEVSQLFRADDPDAACLTAWVVIEASRAWVCVAGAGRCRYVFRELALEHPLSELDRERVAQVAKAALFAVGDSPESVDCALPPVVVVPAPVASTSPAPPPTTIDASPSSTPWSSLAIGASYGGTYHRGGVSLGPALLMAMAEPTWRYEPELWLDLRYVLPHSYVAEGETIQTIAGRAGVSLGAWSYGRVGLGAGVDRERTTFELLSPGGGPIPSRYTSWEPAARLFARLSTRSWQGFSLSGTLLFDAVHEPDPQSTVRIGLTVEAWWRS